MQSKIRRKAPAPGPAVRVSRIRRDPVRVPTEAELKQVEVRKREREVLTGIAGIILFGAAIAAVTIGIGVATRSGMDPAAAAAKDRRFGQCYNTVGPNCVLDGDTLRVGRQWVDIAGMEAPSIQSAACVEQRAHGIDAAIRLASLLNSGRVTMSAPFSDAYGRVVRKVEVNGADVARTMISAGVAKTYIGKERDWCRKAGEGGSSDE